VSEKARELLKSMLQFKVENRLNWRKFWKHEIFQKEESPIDIKIGGFDFGIKHLLKKKQQEFEGLMILKT